MTETEQVLAAARDVSAAQARRFVNVDQALAGLLLATMSRHAYAATRPAVGDDPVLVYGELLFRDSVIVAYTEYVGARVALARSAEKPDSHSPLAYANAPLSSTRRGGA